MAGCGQQDVSETPPPVIVGQLTPYLTATPSQTPGVEKTGQVNPASPTDIPVPTPTPFVYAVVENDTLIGIAFRHSVTLENLIAANPGLDPNFLTIGLTLTVPIEGVVSAALPTPTPIPIVLQEPVCYPLADGGLQCLVVVENDENFAVENVVVLVSLLSPDAETQSQTAYAPLNILPEGQKAAVSATFDPPLPTEYQSQASLLSVIPISVDDQRYLKTEIQMKSIEISEDGQQASVSGLVTFLGDQADATTVWVAVYAYDAKNNIVGIRKWMADDIVLSDSQVIFDVLVYSLGFPIDYVEVLTEARP